MCVPVCVLGKCALPAYGYSYFRALCLRLCVLFFFYMLRVRVFFIYLFTFVCVGGREVVCTCGCVGERVFMPCLGENVCSSDCMHLVIYDLCMWSLFLFLSNV